MIQRTCVNHAGRRAIGVCVETRQPICAECSTRYEGVNYSKQGLEILKQRRAAQGRPKGARSILMKLGLVVLSPVLLVGMYFSLWLLVRYLMLVQEQIG